MKKSEYINLKFNGKLFPTWVMANFKKYKLPEIIKDDDACNKTHKDELRKYQTFIAKYLDNNSYYKDILLYHGLGSGKTATLINLYNVLFNANPNWNLFLLIRASLHNEPWLAELKKWINEENYEKQMKNIYFVHYDSPIADKSFFDTIKESNPQNQNIFVIEEAHNFIKNVYNNLTSQKGKKAEIIYNYIKKEKIEKPETRIICISATPAVNSVFELALMFNLLRPNIFPNSENQFNNIFIKNDLYPAANEMTKNMFQRRILGLVSYYIGATPNYFASRQNHNIDVVMSDYQTGVYKYYDEIEAKQRKHSFGKSESYRTYTRQACNFVFPNIDQYVNGETRPRPGKFKISEKEAAKLEQNEIIDNNKDNKDKIALYFQAIQKFVKTFQEYLRKLSLQDQKNNYTIFDDIELYKNKYYMNYESFETQKHSELFMALKKCSHKMLRMVLNISLSKGPILVYSNYVLMEGLEIFKIYLDSCGYQHINQGAKLHMNYAEFNGNLDQKVRSKIVQIFKNPDNKYGEIAKIILISPAGAEGISLFNIRQIHIMEPYWNETRINQMIGRGIRLCSHKALPKSERHVDVYRYKSIQKDKIPTSDEYIYELALNKENLNNQFLDMLKEAAIDCKLFMNHNKLYGNYKCFQFTEACLFNNNIGPAFKQDIKDDIQISNGLNNINSVTLKLRVIKIKAKILLNQDIKNPQLSQEQDYWYYADTKTVYDFDLQYPVGRVASTYDGLPVKIGEIYIIDRVIPIPLLN